MAAQTPTLVPMGAVLISVLTEGSTPATPASEAQVRAWIARSRAPFTMTLDSVDAPLESYFGRQRDTYIIIDLHTMTVVEVVGSDVNRALRDLRMLLQ